MFLCGYLFYVFILYIIVFFFLMIRRQPKSTLFPYTPLFRSFETFAYILNASPNNYIKFVVADESDLKQMLRVCRALLLAGVTGQQFLISPVDAIGSMITTISDKLKNKNNNLINQLVFSVQIHKLFDLV